jgi:hypothetical protein
VRGEFCIVLMMATSLLASAPVSAYQPAVNYQLHCMGCHRADGTGEAGRVPSLRRTLVPFSRLPEGRDFVMRVPGVAQAPLDDAEVAALLNWMARNLSDVSVDERYVDYTAQEVANARHRPLPALRSVRASLVDLLAN